MRRLQVVQQSFQMQLTFQQVQLVNCNKQMLRKELNIAKRSVKNRKRCLSLESVRVSEHYHKAYDNIQQKGINQQYLTRSSKINALFRNQRSVGSQVMINLACLTNPLSLHLSYQQKFIVSPSKTQSLEKSSTLQQSPSFRVAREINSKYHGQPLNVQTLCVNQLKMSHSEIQSLQKQPARDLDSLKGQDSLFHIPSTITKRSKYLQVQLDLRVHVDQPQLHVTLQDDANCKKIISVIREQDLPHLKGCTMLSLTKFYSILYEIIISQRQTLSKIFEDIDGHLYVYLKRGPKPIYLIQIAQITPISDPTFIKIQRIQHQSLERIGCLGRTWIQKIEKTAIGLMKKIQSQAQICLLKIQSLLQKTQKAVTANLSAQARLLLEEYRTQLDVNLRTYSQTLEELSHHLTDYLQEIYPVLTSQEQTQSQLIKECMALRSELELTETRILDKVKKVQQDSLVKMKGVDLQFKAIDKQLCYVRSFVDEIRLGTVDNSDIAVGQMIHKEISSKQVSFAAQTYQQNIVEIDQEQDAEFQQRLERLKINALKQTQQN